MHIQARKNQNFPDILLSWDVYYSINQEKFIYKCRFCEHRGPYTKSNSDSIVLYRAHLFQNHTNK